MIRWVSSDQGKTWKGPITVVPAEYRAKWGGEEFDADFSALGIGLDENTAIVVRGDNFQVIGESYAIIYDARTTTGADGKFYFLAPGDRFNLVTREATRAATTLRAIDNVQKKPWGGR